MEKVSVLVVEDEILIADSICKNLRELGYNVFEPVLSYTEALEAIEQKEPDIAILDIQLSGNKTGIDLAKKIHEEYSFPFLFLSSNSDALTVNDAKRVNPQAFLVKPFTKNELYTAVELALYNHANIFGNANTEDLLVADALFIKSDGIYSKICFDEILYIKSSHVYIELMLKAGQKRLVRCSLNEILEKLDNHFIRVHRGYIVNSEHITILNSDSLLLSDVEIPIGKSYKKELFKKVITI